MASSQSDFCYYKELGVEKTATASEIVSAYRKLAFERHPDRNPNDPEATANFQRLQAAYETLSDSTKRSKYDSPPAEAHNPFAESDDGDLDFERDLSSFFSGGVFGDRIYFDYGPPRQPPSYARRPYEEQERERQEYQTQWPSRHTRQNSDEAVRTLKKKAKEAEEEVKKQAFDLRETSERAAQEKRWKELNSTTEAEKQTSCLHSEFWRKDKQRKKFRCGPCGQKRGIVVFKCPHCDLLVCQVCLNCFKRQRERST